MFKTVKETARVLGVSTTTVYRAIWTGDVTTCRLRQRGRHCIPSQQFDRTKVPTERSTRPSRNAPKHVRVGFRRV